MRPLADPTMALQLDEHLDLHLIAVLYVLITERSVTRAAVRLNHTQPAVSIALRKLRQLTGDEILVRSRNGMVPTPRAEAMAESAHKILTEVNHLFSKDQVLEPLQMQRRFTLGCLDYMGADLLNRVLERMLQSAPHIQVKVEFLSGEDDPLQRLERNEWDCVISNWPSPPPQLRAVRIHQDDFVLLMHRDHALARQPQPSLEEIVRHPHVAVHSDYQIRKSNVDEFLHRLGLKRDITVSVPSFSTAASLISRLHLLFIADRTFGQALCARDNHLAMARMPATFPKVELYLFWHSRHQAAPEHQWLRKSIVQAMQPLDLPHRESA